jgi:SH3-like domain-containing protein
MYRHGRVTLIAAGCTAVLGAMLLIPGERQIAVADVPAVTSVTSHETIAAIDAMLSPPALPAAPLPERARAIVGAPEPNAGNFQTAALTTPEAAAPPALDPSLRPDAIGPSAVNLRAGPSSSTSTITVLQPGQAVHTGATDGGWVEITLPDGTTGWVYSRYLASVAATAPAEPEQPAPKAEKAKTAKAVIKGNANGKLEGRTARIEASLDARSIPSKSARTIFRTEPGERVRIVDVRGKWLRIVTADGSSGWIQAG